MSGTNSDWAILKSQAKRIFADPIFLFVKHHHFIHISSDSKLIVRLTKKLFKSIFVCVFLTFLTLLNHLLQKINPDIAIFCLAVSNLVHVEILLRKYLKNG